MTQNHGQRNSTSRRRCLRALLIALGVCASSCGRWGYDLMDLEPPGDGSDGDCSDQLQNGRESDIDCGGDDCEPCDEGQGCVDDDDCVTASCNQTAAVCASAHCADGQISQDETGSDCGGSCEPCPDGDPCLMDADCTSRVCAGDVCQGATCDDGVENGNEDGPDCGGSCPDCDGGGTGGASGGTAGSGGGGGSVAAGGMGGVVNAGGAGGVSGTGGAGGVSGTGGAGGVSGTGGAGGVSGTGGAGGVSGTGGAGGVSGTGGAGGVSGTGGAGGVSGTGGAGSGGTGGTGVVGDFVVTTSADDDDGGTGGTGLSLREAIDLANATGGHQVITFYDSSINPTLTLGPLPIISEAVDIIGTGNLITGSSVSNSRCFHVNADDVRFENLEITGCIAHPIFASAGNRTQIIDCYIHDNGDSVWVDDSDALVQGNVISGCSNHVLAVYSANAMILDNVISDGSAKCVYLDRTADGVTVMGNLLLRCDEGIGFSNLDGASVWHNTISGHGATGITVGQAASVDIRNNIVTHNGSFGVNAAPSNLAALDHNLLFQNTLGDCGSGCTHGPNSEFGDPLYNDPGNDYSLDPNSPAIDAGLDFGARSFNGSAPDMGYAESN